VPFGWFNPSAGRFALTSPKYDSYNALLLDLSLAERSTQMHEDIVIIGGGLAGSEAAWQAANRGAKVTLYEMRPKESTPAHKTGGLAELVCSNSLGSADPQNAAGILKEEMRRHQSLIIKVADQVRVPAGSALAVDRDQFSFLITQALDSHPNVRILREEMTEIPTDCVCIVATGPLTSDKLSQAIARLTHSNHLYFYDAISPIVDADSINMDIAFRASRYGKGGDDYLNCPMDEATYQAFYDALLAAEKVQPKAFEQTPYFEACLPIEVMAERGRQSRAPTLCRCAAQNGKRPPVVLQHGRIPDEIDLWRAEAGFSHDPWPRTSGIPAVRQPAPQHVHKLAAAVAQHAAVQRAADALFRRPTGRCGRIHRLSRDGRVCGDQRCP
jgi:tRNA:m(5)U-54 methyltransferase